MLDYALWIIVILLSILVAVYGLVVFWQRRVQNSLKASIQRLRKLGEDSNRLRRAAQVFSTDDPEPFGSLDTRLEKQLDRLMAVLRDLLERYGKLQGQARSLFKITANSLPRLPYDWYLAQAQASRLHRDIDKASGLFKQAEEILKEMNRQGWNLAVQARLALEEDQNALRVLSELRGANVRDGGLEASFQEGQRWEKSIQSQVPVYFMSGDEASVLEQADKATIVKVHELVSMAQPAVSTLHKQAKQWEALLKNLEKSLDELAAMYRETSKRVESAESSRIHPLVWDESRGPFSSLRVQIERLGSIQKTRTIDQLELDQNTALELMSRLKELGERVEAVIKNYQELLSLISAPEIRQGLEWSRSARKLAMQIEGYNPENWPIELGVASLREEIEEFIELQETLNFATLDTPVNESELPEFLEEAKRLAELHGSLHSRLGRIQAIFTDLQALEARTRDNLARSRSLINQATALARANDTLAGPAVRDLENQKASLEPLLADIDHPGVDTIEKKARQADTLLRSFSLTIYDWLERLEHSLDQKKSLLREKTEILYQIAPLEDAPIAEAQRLLEGYTPSGNGRGGSLSHASDSLKSRSPFGAPSEVEPGGGKPLQRLAGGLKQRVTQAAASLPRSSPSPAGESLNPSDAIARIKLLSEEWQRCVAALSALEDLEKPVIERYQKATEQRGAVRQLIARALELIPEGKGWPPTSQALSGERGQVDSLEKRWAALQSEPVKAIHLVSKLGAISEEYSNLAGRIHGVVDRAEQEQNKTRDLERHFQESKDIWGEMRDINPGNSLLRGEIQMLLQEADHQYEAIKDRYLKGMIPYNQVVQNLRSVCQNLDSALVSVDDQTVVDINGDTSAVNEQ